MYARPHRCGHIPDPLHVSEWKLRTSLRTALHLQTRTPATERHRSLQEHICEYLWLSESQDGPTRYQVASLSPGQGWDGQTPLMITYTIPSSQLQTLASVFDVFPGMLIPSSNKNHGEGRGEEALWSKVSRLLASAACPVHPTFSMLSCHCPHLSLILITFRWLLCLFTPTLYPVQGGHTWAEGQVRP